MTEKRYGLKSERSLQLKIRTVYAGLVHETVFSNPVIFVIGDRLDAKLLAYEISVQHDLAYVSFVPVEIIERGYSLLTAVFDNKPQLPKLVHVECIKDLDKDKLENILNEALIKIKFNETVHDAKSKVLFSCINYDFTNLSLKVEVETGTKQCVLNIMKDKI